MVSFKMLGLDVDAVPTQYRTWVVENAPDFTGALYTGPKAGDNPLVDISAYAILDPTVVADFNLPVPTMWQNFPGTPFDFYGRRNLPNAVSDAALAVIDGYIYIFGGQVSNAIYQASIGDPGTWINTGATLPTVLANASLAIIGDYIYLFGGNVGDEANSQQPVNTIYSAPVSNPLEWTNLGSFLPAPIHSAALGMANGYIFLAGGRGASGASDVVYVASTSNPLSWSAAPGILPTPLYGSTIIQSQGYWYLLGGQDGYDQVVSTIFRTNSATPFIWQNYGNMLYPTSYGAFFPMAYDGYYIGSAVGDGYDSTTYTPIVQVPLNSITQWINPQQTVPAVISHSQSAIIYDRFWFFGGSGSSAIFTNAQILKYPFYYPTVVVYGAITRTLFQSSDNLDNPFLVLGIPYWITDYQI